nr:hypothetical protein [uncultured Dethiosulfovibrio sp.]
MKKILFALSLCLLCCSLAFAAPQDFVLINKTGVDIYVVYVSPSDSDDWGEDVMDEDILPNGESVMIEFPGKQRDSMWDIRVEDEDGDYLEWHGFNLKRVSEIVLLKNGQAQYQ